MKYIAVCNDIFQLKANRILDREWDKKYPGSKWVSFFANRVKERGFTVVTGDIALSHVRAGYLDARDVLVIQELNSLDAIELIKRGAKPWILTGFESPIFAYSFYDDIKHIAQIFQRRILFSGAFKDIPDVRLHANIQACFPAYDDEDILPLVPWTERKYLAMVAANKHWKIRLWFSRNPMNYIRQVKELLRRLLSPACRYAVRNELHSKRLSAIEYFGGKGRLDLYGSGWDKTKNLPFRYRKSLRKILPKLSPKPCIDKVRVIAGYKYSICFENTVYPGYLTEKIVDCFVAGTIPVYMGAPDILEHIPGNAFIDVRKFNSWKSLESYLDGMTKEKAIEMLNAGRQYLNSADGKNRSYQGFSEFVCKLLHEDYQRETT